MKRTRIPRRIAPRRATRIPIGLGIGIAAIFVVVQAGALLMMGQPLICTCGTIKIWTGVVSGPENSQQLTDWYTYTHIIHGVAFYFLLWLVAPRMSVGMRFVIAIGLEASWEIIENTPFIIERYRQVALAQGYFGDSVVNSIVDTVAGAVGFALARILAVWSSVVLVVAIEMFLAYAIHDDLTLNIVQLVYPTQVISRWQTGK